MLPNRYDPMNVFEMVPKLGREMDPELVQLDRLLDDDILFQKVRADLVRRSPHTATRGRYSIPVEVILRMLVVKRLYRWSYEETEHFVSDRLILRQFGRVYLETVPDDTTLIRWAKLIGPQTLEQLNERAVQLARSLKVTRGRKLRRASAVVETTIHYPTDSGILGAGVRVLSRLLRRAKALVGEKSALPKTVFQSHTRSVRRLARQMHRGPEGTPRRKGEEAAAERKGADPKLIQITQRSQAQARRVCDILRQRWAGAAQPVVQQFEMFLPRIDQAIRQAVRRVIAGEVVPAQEKILSVFEPHTQVIVRHKTGQAVEFGRKRAAPWAGKKSRGASSVAIGLWRMPGTTVLTVRTASPPTGSASANRPISWRALAGAPPPRTNAWPERQGETRRSSLGWEGGSGAQQARTGTVVSAGLSLSGEDRRKVPPGEGGQRVDESVSCAAAMGWTAVRIMVSTGWAAMLAGAS